MLKWLTQVFSSRSAAQVEPSAAEPSPRQLAQQDSEARKREGDEHLRAGALEAAEKAYRAALGADAANGAAQLALADLLRDQSRLDEAAAGYRAVLGREPGNAFAYYGLGAAHLERGELANAEACFNNALTVAPSMAKAHNGIGFVRLESGRRDDAVASFRKALACDADNGMARHLVASLTEENPERAPSQYVELLFNGFAHSFDQQLKSLQYDTPRRLIQWVNEVAGDDTRRWQVLDLGCGTGLAGVEVKARAARLVGVDLSPGMLGKARSRNIYDRLECMDLVAMMRQEPASSYDLLVSADTFIYVGRLDDVVSEARRLLQPGGLFAFSVESLDALPDLAATARAQAGYALQASPSCRYAHATSYLTRLAGENGFKMSLVKPESLRMSHGHAVQGYCMVWQLETSITGE